MIEFDIDAENITIVLEDSITPEDSEKCLEAIARDQRCERRLLLDFRSCRHISAFAGPRIGNALKSISGDRTIAVFVPGELTPKDATWFKLFTSTGLGDALVHNNAVFVKQGKQITDEVTEYYTNRKVRIGTTEATLLDVAVPGVMNVDDFDIFKGQIAELTGSLVGFEAPENKESPNTDSGYFYDAYAIASSAFEAVQNIYDHAGKDPQSYSRPLFSSIRITYHKALYGQIDETAHLSEYLTRIAREYYGQKSLPPRFAKISVVDDGVGIAARHVGSFECYLEGNYRIEYESFARAFKARESSKPRSKDSTIRGTPGFGFDNMMRHLDVAKGFASLRSGRCRAVFAWGSSRHRGEFELLPDIHGYLPGSVFEILLPLKPADEGISA